MTVERTDVVIVGAGPVGLGTAIGLAQKGISFAIFDALAEQQNTSRAAVIHSRTLETLDQVGVTPRLVAQGIRVPMFRIRDRDRELLGADFRNLEGPFPFLLMIPQDETEAVLVQRLSELGHEVVRPANANRIERLASGGARVECETPSGTTIIECRYLVGADGQHSKVRESADISFPGSTYGSFLLADVHMEWPIAHDEVTLFFSAEGTLVVAPMSGERHRVVAQLADAPSAPTAADVQRIIDTRGPIGGGIVREVLWGSRFKVNHRLATSFRSGPFLLAGDAAHVHSPAGGQGMNLGLRDAVALSDALEQALAGRDADAALDRYANIQRAAAQRVLKMTDRLTRVATMRGKFARRLRNRALHTLGLVPGVRQKLARTLAGYE